MNVKLRSEVLCLCQPANRACDRFYRVTICLCFGGTVSGELVPDRVGMFTLHLENFESCNKHAQEFLIREQFSRRP